MALHYAKSTGGFYDSAMGGRIPADAVPLAASEHAALLAAQARGEVITADAQGRPQVLRPAACVPMTRLAAASLAESDADMHRIAEAVILGEISWNSAEVVAFAAWRRALREIVRGTACDTIPPRPVCPACL